MMRSLLLLTIGLAMSYAFQAPQRRISSSRPSWKTLPGALFSSTGYLSSLSGNDPSPSADSRMPPIESKPSTPQLIASSSPAPPSPSSPQPQLHASSQSNTTPTNNKYVASVKLIHASLNDFAPSKMTPKGPRPNADVGKPHDRTLRLGQDRNIRAGTWWCAAGGWPSFEQRATTEIFHVIKGQGCLTDLDGMRHYFGPGDVVILPKGWSGRWDVLEDIHNVWFVHEHPDIEHKTNPIRVEIANYNSFAPQHMIQHGVRKDAIHGSPSATSRTLYEVGPTEVGVWTCTAGSFPVMNRPTTECLHVLEGVFFLTNASDGSARRCVAGDTVILPKGWSGYWDVIEPLKKLWVIV